MLSCGFKVTALELPCVRKHLRQDPRDSEMKPQQIWIPVTVQDTMSLQNASLGREDK